MSTFFHIVLAMFTGVFIFLTIVVGTLASREAGSSMPLASLAFWPLAITTTVLTLFTTWVFF